MSDLEHCRPPSSPWRTEQIGVFTDRVLNRIPALRDFAANALARLEGQQRMREGVVPDDVSALGDFGGDIGPLMHIAADQKKCCMNGIPGQNVKQVLRMWIIGPVIKGQRNLS